MLNKFLKYNLLLVLVFTLTSCEEAPEVDDRIIVKRPAVKKVEEKKEVELSEEEKRRVLLQNMRAGRNPFKSYIREDDVVDRGPLECCDISQFTVLAVLNGMQGGDRAKVLVPSGNKYTIQIGTKIGNRKGKVYKISDGTIFIKEKHKNVLGEEETVRVEISLPSVN